MKAVKGLSALSEIMILIGFALTVSGCKRYEPAVAPEPVVETQAEPKSVVLSEKETKADPENDSLQELIREETDGRIPSYLTGEWIEAAMANRRPAAVMISNDKAAHPHYGINHAGVIYEAPVEGGMNRFMALIEDFDNLDRIGSVRSCRTYYTYLAREFEAMYVHYGQSVFALPYLERMEHINGIDGKGGAAFFRSKDRNKPHNAYTSGSGILKAADALGYSMDYPDSYKGHYRFAKPDYPVLLENGFSAFTVKPGYLMNAPWFEYKEGDGLYYRFQYGGPHLGNEGQLSVKNIIFQYCSWEYYKSSEYLDIRVHNSGPGYFFTNGRGIAIDWKKDGEFGVTKYYDKEGQELLLNPGKTWVCIITNDRIDKAEFYGEQTD